MAFAVLVGVVLLLGLGLALALRATADARRDLDDLEEELADARGLGLNLARDPDPESWSAVDFEILRAGSDVVDEQDPYAMLTPADSEATWHAAPDPIRSEVPADAVEQTAAVEQTGAVEPATTDLRHHSWQAPGDTPMVVLVVGVGFLGAGGAAVTTAARMQVPLHEMHTSGPAGGKADNSDVPPLSSFYDATVVRDEIVRHGLTDPSPTGFHEQPTGNGHRSGNGSEPERIAWRAPAPRR